MTSLADLIADSWFPFAGDITVKPLEPPVVPEPPRAGLTADDCHACGRDDDTYLWTDRHWRLHGMLPTQIPGIVLLETRAHIDSFADMPAELLAEIGPMAARVEQVLHDALDDVARVHVNRWGDGGAHFHLWFMPRPLGALQLRGSMLPMWLDLMPDLDDAAAHAALDAIAARMAASA
jgi:diadenosine tetraphosphate (Ap4A) HIT family hydrolase